MFQGCKGLTSLDLTNFDLNNGKVFYNMFNDCENLTIILNEKAKTINNFMESIPENIIIQ